MTFPEFIAPPASTITEEQFDLSDVDLEVPCQQPECDLPARWALNWAGHPCGCKANGLQLICDEKHDWLKAVWNFYARCADCGTSTHLKFGDLILSLTPLGGRDG